TFIAPSKTYNLAGLGCSIAIIPNPGLRNRFVSASRGIMAEVNNLGYAACEAAYRNGDPWREELLRYLCKNRDLIQEFAREHLQDARLYEHEATYLSWLDVSALGLKDPIAHFESHGIGLSDGSFFDNPSHVRLNFACPRSTLEEGLKRLRNGFEAVRG
ncbi:MAG: aspartate aminotransferase, partial [Opitutales bacterium]|nr:aspartate aminotransferase [Opitutales bacterium]